MARAAAAAVAASSYSGFIRVSNERFVDDACKEFLPLGLNAWQLMEVGSGVVGSQSLDPLDDLFELARTNSMNTVRFFAHGINASYALQTAPGVYNETYFQGLDLALAAAARHDIKVIITMGNNWGTGDAKNTYGNWSGCYNVSDAMTWECFWVNPLARQMYKRHMLTMVSRVNTVNGRLWRDDPTIFAINLINEPRCECHPTHIPLPYNYTILPSCQNTCPDVISAWINEMSAFLRSVDPNHLISIGEEGYWGAYDPSIIWNPNAGTNGGGWVPLSGQNFTNQTANPAIDFASIHLWPDQWKTPSVDFSQNWIQSHMRAAASLNKPLILEEFGKELGTPVVLSNITERRDPYFREIYNELLSSLRSNGILRGTLFWEWALDTLEQRDGLTVLANDTTFTDIIVPALREAKAYASPAVPGCQHVAPEPAVPPVQLARPAAPLASVPLPLCRCQSWYPSCHRRPQRLWVNSVAGVLPGASVPQPAGQTATPLATQVPATSARAAGVLPSAVASFSVTFTPASPNGSLAMGSFPAAPYGGGSVRGAPPAETAGPNASGSVGTSSVGRRMLHD
ncbi:hypothetical protein WJX81_000642 [Elliptochloris bilobata]|uniref:mannan endo-1,4-beta-mannosidase n=1 Tax=Elliptochloris bilobata TaxID=381761 RepID=A0AAW1QXA3_9CHLO